MKLSIRVALVCFLITTAAWAQSAQVSVNYLYQRSKQTAPSGDWFGANGVRSDLNFGDWRKLSVATEFSGVHTSVEGQGITLFTYMAGPRFTHSLGKGQEQPKMSVFGQVLAGGVHASNGLYPVDGAYRNSADSFALSIGSGLQRRIGDRISLRLVQADYLYTRLPNYFDNYQGSFRLGAGVAFRLR